MRAFAYAQAETREGALAALADGWRPKAGGIDLLDHLKERLGPPGQPRLVDLGALSDMRGIRRDAEGALVIGALTTLHELGESAEVRQALPALAHAAAHAATPQIRARATVGGNICQRPRCWYYRAHEYRCLKKGGSTCFAVEGENEYHALFGGGPCHIVHPSNLAPVLVAANAVIITASAAGEGRSIPADEFFVLPSANMHAENVLREDELITEIRIPHLPVKSGHIELRHKQSFDWPLATAAVCYHTAHGPGTPIPGPASIESASSEQAALERGAPSAPGWRVVLGHVAPVPWRAASAEALLAHETTITAELAERASEAALEGAEPMSQNAWRLKLAKAAVRRALLVAEGIEDNA